MKKNRIFKRILSVVIIAFITFTSAVSVNSVYVSAEESEVPSIDLLIYDYYSRAAFVGDSLMVGFRNYSEKFDNAYTKTSQFLAAKSFASYYALRPTKSPKKQPEYQGQHLAVWDSISKMNVDKVFIYLGTNDLVGISPEASSDNLIALATNIQTTNPNVSIHIIGMAPVYAGTNKGYLNNSDVNKYNELTKEKAIAAGFSFIDLNPYLRDSNGNLKSEFCSDKYVHMTYDAYAVWNQVLYDYALNQIIASIQVEQ